MDSARLNLQKIMLADHKKMSINHAKSSNLGDPLTKYEESLKNWEDNLAQAEVWIVRISPGRSDHGTFPILEHHLTSYGQMVQFVKENLWDGSAAIYEWKLRHKGMYGAVAKLELGREVKYQRAYEQRMTQSYGQPQGYAPSTQGYPPQGYAPPPQAPQGYAPAPPALPPQRHAPPPPDEESEPPRARARRARDERPDDRYEDDRREERYDPRYDPRRPLPYAPAPVPLPVPLPVTPGADANTVALQMMSQMFGVLMQSQNKGVDSANDYARLQQQINDQLQREARERADKLEMMRLEDTRRLTEALTRPPPPPVPIVIAPPLVPPPVPQAAGLGRPGEVVVPPPPMVIPPGREPSPLAAFLDQKRAYEKSLRGFEEAGLVPISSLDTARKRMMDEMRREREALDERLREVERRNDGRASRALGAAQAAQAAQPAAPAAPPPPPKVLEPVDDGTWIGVRMPDGSVDRDPFKTWQLNIPRMGLGAIELLKELLANKAKAGGEDAVAAADEIRVLRELVEKQNQAILGATHAAPALPPAQHAPPGVGQVSPRSAPPPAARPARQAPTSPFAYAPHAQAAAAPPPPPPPAPVAPLPSRPSPFSAAPARPQHPPLSAPLAPLVPAAPASPPPAPEPPPPVPEPAPVVAAPPPARARQASTSPFAYRPTPEQVAVAAAVEQGEEG